MLYGADYHRFKARVMGPVDQFPSLLDGRTKAEVHFALDAVLADVPRLLRCSVRDSGIGISPRNSLSHRRAPCWRRRWRRGP